MPTGTLGIVLQLTDSFKKTQHHSVHLGACLARVADELHCFQHRATASRRKLFTHDYVNRHAATANNTAENHRQNQYQYAKEKVIHIIQIPTSNVESYCQ